MNRKTYNYCRRMLRQNGRIIVRYVGQHEARLIRKMVKIQDQHDPLEERAFVIAMCKREGVEYNFRQIM